MARDYSRHTARPLRDVFLPDRMGRIGFLVRSSVVNALAFLVLPMPDHTAPTSFAATPQLFTFLAIFACFAAYSILGIVRPRLRDLGWSSIWAWLVLVPLLNAVFGFMLLLTPGQGKIATDRTR